MGEQQANTPKLCKSREISTPRSCESSVHIVLKPKRFKMGYVKLQDSFLSLSTATQVLLSYKGHSPQYLAKLDRMIVEEYPSLMVLEQVNCCR